MKDCTCETEVEFVKLNEHHRESMAQGKVGCVICPNCDASGPRIIFPPEFEWKEVEKRAIREWNRLRGSQDYAPPHRTWREGSAKEIAAKLRQLQQLDAGELEFWCGEMDEPGHNRPHNRYYMGCEDCDVLRDKFLTELEEALNTTETPGGA